MQLKKLRIENIGVVWEKLRLKRFVRQLKRPNLLLLHKRLPWHFRLFLGSRCASFDLVLLFIGWKSLNTDCGA